MKKSLSVLFMACVILALLSGCKKNTPPPPPAEYTPIFTLEDMPVIDGSTATVPLAELAIQRTTGCTEEQARETVEFTKTDNAYYRLYNGECDILLVYEGYTDPDGPDMSDAFEVHSIGKDALVFLTNQSNAVDGLTTQQIRDIYSGAVTNWSEIGGDETPIEAYQRQPQSGSGVMMEKLVMQGLPMVEAPSDYIIGEMEGLVSIIGNYQNKGGAIGYSVFYYVTEMYLNSGIKLLSIDEATPSKETIADDSYPFINDFYAIVRKDAPPDSPARKMLEWIQSPPGRQTIIDAGYVPK